MIKVIRVLPVLAVLLSFSAASASAATFCAAGPSAMSQLLASTPGGADSLSAIVVRDPVASLVARGEMSSALEYDTTRADALLKGLAASARSSGKVKAAGLLTRLLKEGTPAEKLVFMNATSKPYSFPSRFTEAVQAGGVCRTVAELFCKLSCIHTGDGKKDCTEDCRTIFVTTCD